MKIAGYPVHPAANFFPLITGEEFDEFALDIQQRGLREKIVLFEGKISRRSSSGSSQSRGR